MKEKLIDKQWVDIVQPLTPPGNELLWWMITISLCAGAGLLYYFLWYRRPRQQLARRLRSLQKRVPASANRKSILHQLEGTLCRYHGIASVAQRDTLHPHWWPPLETLTHYRYQKQQPSSRQLLELLQQCMQLLNNHSRDHVQ